MSEVHRLTDNRATAIPQKHHKNTTKTQKNTHTHQRKTKKTKTQPINIHK